jgi:hypothetical protein
LKRYLTRGHENASIIKRPVKFWAHVLHFAVECSSSNVKGMPNVLMLKNWHLKFGFPLDFDI